jgi:hypothetical protein
MDDQTILGPDIQRKLAAKFFNETWRLIEKPDRTEDDDSHMIHLAHASRLHWQSAGGARQWSTGEWQISRVYSILKRAEPALYHARLCLRLAMELQLSPFQQGCAHEAMARALAITADSAAARHITEAKGFLEEIADPEDRDILEQDLASIPSHRA